MWLYHSKFRLIWRSLVARVRAGASPGLSEYVEYDQSQKLISPSRLKYTFTDACLSGVIVQINV